MAFWTAESCAVAARGIKKVQAKKNRPALYLHFNGECLPLPLENVQDSLGSFFGL
jgi:hypothetical protein